MLIFSPCLLPHLPTRPFPPCLAHPFTPMSLAFAAFFNCPIIVQELGSYLLFIYKYINIKETLPPPLFPPVSPTTLCAAFLISALKVMCCRGLIWGRGFRASWVLFLLGLPWPFCQLRHCPVSPSPPCGGGGGGGDHPAEGAGSPTPAVFAQSRRNAEYCFRNPPFPVRASFPR